MIRFIIISLTNNKHVEGNSLLLHAKKNQNKYRVYVIEEHHHRAPEGYEKEIVLLTLLSEFCL